MSKPKRPNQWKTQRLKAGNLPPDVAHAEASFGRCPNGHKLPNRTNQGECSPLFCAMEKKAKAAGPKVEKARRAELKRVQTEGDAHLDKLMPPSDPLFGAAREEAAEEKVQTVSRIAKAVGRLAARKAFFKVPAGLKGAEAEEWVTQHAMELAPDALAELEYQLKLGDDAQRRDAARDLLDMVGMRKKDNGGGHGATIVLNLGGAPLPWAARPAQVVEGTVTKDEKEQS